MRSLFDFFDNIRGKKIIILGLTDITEELCRIFPWEVSSFIDTERENVGKRFHDKEILSLDNLVRENKNEIVVIISGGYNISLEEWLSSIGLKNNIHYWFGANLLAWYQHNNSKHSIQEQPLNIIMMDGGLASQMLKFGIGRLLEKELNVKVKYDLSWFEKGSKDINGIENRNFCLTDVFNINIDIATQDEIKQYKAFHYYNHSKYYTFDENLLIERCERYIDGYFANSRYFSLIQEELKKELVYKIVLNKQNLDIIKQIQSSEISIAIHVRRGDYVGSVHEVLSADYYQSAIKFLVGNVSSKNIRLFIFSDNIQWAKNNLQIKYPVTYVECNNNDQGAFDMYLMSKCKYFIISNSVFGWWPAWLSDSQDKIVISPDKWFNTEGKGVTPEFLSSIEGHDRGAFVPLEWIKLSI